MRWIISFFLLSISCLNALSETTKERMIKDLDFIENEFYINYAPYLWKKEAFGWELKEEIALAKAKISAIDSLTTKKYHQILRDFFSSASDLHAGIDFYVTEYAILPFLVQGTSDHLFVVWVDETWSHLQRTSLEVGDEIISFNGKSALEIVDTIQKTIYGNHLTQTTRRLSEMQLTIRDANRVEDIPKGSVEIGFIKKKTGKFHQCKTTWNYSEEEIHCLFENAFFNKTNNPNPFFYKKRSLPLYEKWQRHNLYGMNILGAKNSRIPLLGDVSWKSQSQFFDAYIFTWRGREFGFIRIPDFHGDLSRIQDFQTIIALMEKKTEGLLIDVSNNPGGFAFYTFAIASFLTNKPLVNLLESCSITPKDLFTAICDLSDLKEVRNDEDAVKAINKDLAGFVVDKRLATAIIEHAKFIKDQYDKGHFFTENYPVEGVKYIYPHNKTHYSKPILVFTNELSISCADFFPALLQDNQRAKIVGSNTAGAGGYVIQKNYSNRFGIKGITLTGSLIRRQDGSSLENKGVTPDYPYSVSEKDYQDNFSELKEFLQGVLKDAL